MNKKIYKLLLTGGGTGGSVSPLLAMAEELQAQKKDNFEFLWLGTKNGPEKQMVEKENIKFKAISGGKLRRYFSFRNLVDIILIKVGFFQSLYIILKYKPDLIISAGSFISVPVVWAGWLLGVPSLIHQQDVLPGLANKLMVPFVRTITVTFRESLKDFGKKAVWTGNPTRITNYELRIKNYKSFGLDDNLPTLLVMGGGTGALAINKLVEESLDEVTKFCQIIHITGEGKSGSPVILEPKAIESHGEEKKPDPVGLPSARDLSMMTKKYVSREFLNVEQMAEAYALADIVVSRAGLATLTELSFLGKPTILIPIPDSHQLENAKMFQQAAVVLDQKTLNAEQFVNEIKKIVQNKNLQSELSQNISQAMKRDANQAMVKIINDILKRT